jgi:hypothetical protein
MRLRDAEDRPVDSFPELRATASLGAHTAERIFTGAAMTAQEVFARLERGELVAFDLPWTAVMAGQTRLRATESLNVVGRVVGSDPALAAEHVVLTAHLDHVGIGAPVNGDNVYNGAFDNALGTAVLIEAARQHANNRQPRLIGLNHAVAGDVFALEFGSGRSKWELGRDAGADIRIPDDSVSGRHAQLIREQGRWKVVNLMSVNGTFVNGRKVLSAYLTTTDKIRLGNVELAFDAGDDIARGGAGGSGSGPLARLGAWLRGLFGRS